MLQEVSDEVGKLGSCRNFIAVTSRHPDSAKISIRSAVKLVENHLGRTGRVDFTMNTPFNIPWGTL